MKPRPWLWVRLQSAIVAVAYAAGCAESPAPAALHAAAQAGAQPFRETPSAAAPREAAARATRSAIEVDDEIARACDMPLAYFEFDSAAVSGGARRALDALAACFTTGALKARSLKIVGHADPRGTRDYNFALGQRRAGSVADYLIRRGLPEARVITTSMGELEASGSSERGWARDRKVELLVADRDEEG